jgi:hypothetical protein
MKNIVNQEKTADFPPLQRRISEAIAALTEVAFVNT